MRPLFPPLLLGVALGAAAAQTAPAAAQTTPAPVASAPQTDNALSTFLRATANYPSLVQSRLAVSAAQQQLDAANFIFSGNVSASSTSYFSVDAAPNVCEKMPVLKYTALCANVPGSVQTLNATLRASPWNVGDVGARREQAALNLDLARIGYRAAVATVQTQAINAAQRLRLAQRGLTLAQQAVSAANLAQQAAQNSFKGGGATQNDLTSANLAAQQAQNALTQAQENVTLARAALQDLTGLTEAPATLPLSLPATGKPASVQQAEVALSRAQSVAKQTAWNVLPSAQASYVHYTGEKTGIGLSIDSKTLSPAANLVYAPRSAPLSRVNNQFTLAANFDFSANTWAGPAIAQNQVEQARATLQATERQAQLQLDGLNNAYQQAQRDADLAQQQATLAQQQANDAAARRDIGLISPLEAARAQVDAYRSLVNANQTALNLNDATSKFYTFFAQPLTTTP